MNKIDIAALPLLDLEGRRVDLIAVFRRRMLLVFLRHLA